MIVLISVPDAVSGIHVSSLMALVDLRLAPWAFSTKLILVVTVVVADA
jgi:hypothetical protein